MIKYFQVIITLLAFQFTIQAAPLKTFKEPAYQSAIQIVIEQIYQENYSEALNQLDKTVPTNSAYSLYFKGMIYMAIFNDLGDTTALNKAMHTWNKLKLNIETHKKKKTKPQGVELPLDLYHGLVLVQISYIYQIKHQSVKGAMTGKKGIKYLKNEKGYVESRAITAIYEYYKQRLIGYFNWVPFVLGNSVKFRQQLHKYYKSSPYLGNILLTSLIWMHFDEGLNQEALKLTNSFLEKYPRNRSFRAIRADLYYKLGRHQEAQKLFEEIKKEYEEIYQTYPKDKCIKSAYLSIIGNLIRVNHELGNQKDKEKYAKIWFSKETLKIKNWLPKSLLKDLKRFKP